MSKSIFKRIDDEEENRLKNCDKEIDLGNDVSLAQIFGNEDMPKLLDVKPSLFVGSMHASSPELPAKCLINSKILGFICPRCDFAKKPEMLKPYLERGLIVPVLAAPLADYRKAFGEMILEYPYIGSGTIEFLRNDLILSSTDGDGAMCTHCFDKSCKEVVSRIGKVIQDLK